MQKKYGGAKSSDPNKSKATNENIVSFDPCYGTVVSSSVVRPPSAHSYLTLL